MRVDFKRLLLFFLIIYVGEWIITNGVVYAFVSLGITNYYAMILVIEVLVGFLFAYLYYPKEYRRGIFKNPNFYRDAGIFSLIFIAMRLIF